MNAWTLAAVAAVALSVAAPALAVTPAEEANRKLVLEFYRVVLDGHHVDRAKEFLSDGYIQHNPMVPGGLSEFTTAFNRIFAKTLNLPLGPQPRNPLAATAVEKDMVWLMAKQQRPEPSDPTKTYDAFWFDVFRVQGGKIVEHWDGATKPTTPGAPPPA